jgi:hypothetical protein
MIAPQAAEAAAARANSRASLSVVCMTAGPGSRVCAILELLRPLAQEVIVALDDRADPTVVGEVATIADRVIAYPYEEPVDRPLPWLFTECRGEWMLTLDDDEVPSVELLEVLPSLLADDRIVHYSFARRWIYPDTRTYLVGEPWHPDYQLRLFRTDSRLIRFSDELHRPIVPRGPGRFVQQPLLHLDTVLRTREQRLAKAHRYEALRPGMRAAGRALNYAFYVPETRPGANLEQLPNEDRTLLDLVLTATAPTGARRARFETATRRQIDAHWPSHRSEQTGELRIVDPPGPFLVGEERAVDVEVRNTGAATWQWGRAHLPTIRCASWWDGEDRDAAVWTPLPSPVAPLEALVVPVHVRAPSSPGTHRLQFDLVHQDVRWLGCDVSCSVEVRPRRRVAFLAVQEETIRSMLAADPELEPIVLVAAPRSGGDGYREEATPWRYLAEGAPPARVGFTATVLARTVRLLVAAPSADRLPRDGRRFLEALRSCDSLVVGAAPRDASRREAWSRTVTLATARLLRIPVRKEQ